jgi:tetratricopeptide (TPR) repeat protein
MKKKRFLFLTVMAIVFFSCSGAPKKTGDIYELRTHAENLMELGSREAGRGNFNNALSMLNESKRNAVLSDDPSLIIRCNLLRANVLYSLGKEAEAFAEWEQAVKEAEKSTNNELLSVCRIFLARGNLISGKLSAQAVLDEVNREQENIKTGRLYIAFSWQVKGLAYHALKDYDKAEDAVKRSLEIHEKDLYFENASYDWYIIASIRSLSGDAKGALEALNTAITIDRRVENSWGLAASWRAMGDVYLKEKNKAEAENAYNRARAIYEAMGNSRETDEVDIRIAKINTIE